jgi:cytochrome c-type biogenesis protein CcmH
VSLAACSSSQAEVLRNQIRRRLAAGESKEEIVASLEERFGERVLGAPKNEGFGRLAWLGPIIIVLIGLVMIWVFLRRYLAQRPERSSAEKMPRPDPSLRSRIEEELKSHQM